MIKKGELNWPGPIDEDLQDLILELMQGTPGDRLGAGEPGSSNSYEALKNHDFYCKL